MKLPWYTCVTDITAFLVVILTGMLRSAKFFFVYICTIKVKVTFFLFFGGGGEAGGGRGNMMHTSFI